MDFDLPPLDLESTPCASEVPAMEPVRIAIGVGPAGVTGNPAPSALPHAAGGAYVSRTELTRRLEAAGWTLVPPLTYTKGAHTLNVYLAAAGFTCACCSLRESAYATIWYAAARL